MRRPNMHLTNRGISILEVLISMGILAVGLLSVAALFPVGHHYVLSAERFDRGAAVGQAAFNDLRTRGMLLPELVHWKQADGTPFPFGPPNERVDLHGVSVAIDPLWCAVNEATNGPEGFPAGLEYNPNSPPAATGPPVMPRVMIHPDSGFLDWQRIRQAFEQVFTSHDDLVSELPSDADLPAFQLFKRDAAGKPVYRQYAGDYSWMFTVVPVVNQDDSLYLPIPNTSRVDLYRVSVVVFYKRQLSLFIKEDDDQPERIVDIVAIEGGLVDGLGTGELKLYSEKNRFHLDGMKPGEWLMLSGWQEPGKPLFRWYRIVAVDNEIEGAVSGPFTRWVTVVGPAWNPVRKAWATLVDDVVAVYEKTMRIDEF